eukprot:3663149-Pyramimonas_sp.AAC.1
MAAERGWRPADSRRAAMSVEALAAQLQDAKREFGRLLGILYAQLVTVEELKAGPERAATGRQLIAANIGDRASRQHQTIARNHISTIGTSTSKLSWATKAGSGRREWCRSSLVRMS